MTTLEKTKGELLLNSLKASLEQTKEIKKNRRDRINAGLTDMEDCFVSDRIEDTTDSMTRIKIGILENKGIATFPCLRDIETNEIVSIKLVNGKFGDCHLILDKYVNKFGRFIGLAKNESTYTKKGLKQSKFTAPAWVSMKSNGSGMLGAYLAMPQVYISKKNYWTNEYDENYFLD